MNWLAWRQSRANTMVAAAAAVIVLAVLTVTRTHVARFAGTGQLSTGYESLRLLGTGLIGVPAFMGAFWGAPLVARELETGTHRLAWTQSVTRTRWLATRLGLTIVVAAVLTGAFSVAFTWWSQPFDAVGNRVGTATFGQRGIVPVAYAVFAIALGTLVGTVLRRTVPAMAVALAGFFVTRFAFQWVVRPHLTAAETGILRQNLFGQRSPGLEGGGWILSSHTVDAAGSTLSHTQIDRLLAESCDLGRAANSSDLSRCADRIGLHDVVRWHPGSHFWTLQLTESAAFLAMAVVLAAISFWWLRHRTT